MRKPTKFLGALAVAGLVVAGSSAFTAGGLVNSGGTPFVGGSAGLTVTGAVITNVVYDVNEASNKIELVTITFTGAVVAKVPTAVFTGGAVSGTYLCDAISAGFVSICTPTNTTALAADSNFTTLTVTVS